MTAEASGSESYVLFELAGATYALPSDDIQQLEMVSGEVRPHLRQTSGRRSA